MVAAIIVAAVCAAGVPAADAPCSGLRSPEQHGAPSGNGRIGAGQVRNVRPADSDRTKPTILWNSPSSSPFRITADAIQISFECMDDVTCTEATWANDAIYQNGTRSGPARCRVPAAQEPKKTITCSRVRLAPGGVTNRITVTIRDAAGNTADVNITREVIRILDLQVITVHIPDAITNVPYGSGGWPLRCAGGKPPYTWSVVDGSLPSGYSLSKAGVLSGTHTSTGNYRFTVRCHDSQGKPDSAEQALVLSVTPPPKEGPHDYFRMLTARDDLFNSISLRRAAEVASVRNNPHKQAVLTYEYETDPDLRKQDAMKFITPEGDMGPGQQLRIPAGPSNGKNVLITFDFWWGSEHHFHHSAIHDWKGTPAHISAGGALWVGSRINFIYAQQHTQTQPAGGPFVAMTYGQVVGKGQVPKPPQSWCCRMKGHPLTYLPTNVPRSRARHYPESIAPVDDSVVPGGQELGIVGERWTRVWHYLERAPDEDWISQNPTIAGTEMAAYKWTLWMADTKREAMRYVNEAIVGLPKSRSGHVSGLEIQFAPGNSAEHTLYVGRGTLTGYYRNVVVLHGTSKAAVLTLLRKPVQ
jgi:hypothetical protein